jgi:hypothetical protein
MNFGKNFSAAKFANKGGLHHVLLKLEVGAAVALVEAELFAVTMARFVWPV